MALQQRRPIAASRRVAFVAADLSRLLALRTPLLKQILGQGHKVLCATAAASDHARSALAAIGAQHVPFSLPAGPLKLLSDRPATRVLSTVLGDWQPSVVVGIGGKAMQMAGLAARRISGARIVLIASSPDVLNEDSVRAPLGRRWITGRAFGAADAVVVHNAEHAANIRSADALAEKCAVHVLPGAGVDLVHFSGLPMPPVAEGLVFGMISQPLARKGVAQFLEASRIVKKASPKARFVYAKIAGSGDVADTGGFDDAVEMAEAPGDVRPLLAQCHVFVLPSVREGFAQEVAEALACGRPAVTTSVAGCSETVDERVSGVYVPPGDAKALAAAMESFIKRPEQLGWMSQAARLKAERRFDANAVNGRLMEILDLVRGTEAS